MRGKLARFSRKNLAALPEDVQDVFGCAFLDAQYGDTPDGARPFGEGLPHEIWKTVEDFDGVLSPRPSELALH